MPRNSMAAALGVVVTAALWIAAIVGVGGFILLGLGLLASTGDGEMTFPGGSIYVEQRTTLELSVGMIMLAIVAPGVIYICTQLKRILSTLTAGDPFVPENAPRLSRIAIAVAVMELARFCAAFFTSLAVPGDGMRFSINLAAWASVAAILVLSQVFREGTRLREEEKMTI